MPVYYFEDCTPTNSVHLLKYNNNALEINSSNKTESKDIKVENFKLEDHVNENLSKLRKRSSTSNNFLLFLKTNQFIFKAQKELFRRALSYFIKSLSGLIRRKEFFLSTTGN